MWQRVKDTRESECRYLEREQESRKLYNRTDTVILMDKSMTAPKGSPLLVGLSQEHKVVAIFRRKKRTVMYTSNRSVGVRLAYHYGV
jgi:hypothetical protein